MTTPHLIAPHPVPGARSLVELARPQFVHGRWRKPVFSKRKVAEIRRQYLKEGKPFPEAEIKFKFEKEGKIHRNPYLRPPKGHKSERERAARAKKIDENLAKMPKLMEDYKKAQRAEKIKEKPDWTLMIPPKKIKDKVIGSDAQNFTMVNDKIVPIKSLPSFEQQRIKDEWKERSKPKVKPWRVQHHKGELERKAEKKQRDKQIQKKVQQLFKMAEGFGVTLVKEPAVKKKLSKKKKEKRKAAASGTPT